MCKYAILKYKPHYACFKCRKTFKRKLLVDVDRDKTISNIAKCPQCQSEMADMGLDFKAPVMKNIKEWLHLENLFEVGITFHSCGCYGPGYKPKSQETLIHFLEQKAELYRKNYENVVQKNNGEDDKNYWLGRLNEITKATNKIKPK